MCATAQICQLVIRTIPPGCLLRVRPVRLAVGACGAGTGTDDVMPDVETAMAVMQGGGFGAFESVTHDLTAEGGMLPAPPGPLHRGPRRSGGA